MIGGLTYVVVTDTAQGSTGPEGDTSPISFTDYNEAMSYAKWLSTTWTGGLALIRVWNWYGGSGYWRAGTYTAQGNTNYPTP